MDSHVPREFEPAEQPPASLHEALSLDFSRAVHEPLRAVKFAGACAFFGANALALRNAACTPAEIYACNRTSYVFLPFMVGAVNGIYYYLFTRTLFGGSDAIENILNYTRRKTNSNKLSVPFLNKITEEPDHENIGLPGRIIDESKRIAAASALPTANVVGGAIAKGEPVENHKIISRRKALSGAIGAFAASSIVVGGLNLADNFIPGVSHWYFGLRGNMMHNYEITAGLQMAFLGLTAYQTWRDNRTQEQLTDEGTEGLIGPSRRHPVLDRLRRLPLIGRQPNPEHLG